MNKRTLRFKAIKHLIYVCGLVMICAVPGYGMTIQEVVVQTFETNPDVLVQQQEVQIKK